MGKICKRKIVGDSVVFTLEDGTELTYSLKGMSKDTLRIIAVHYISQKIGDAYAGAGSVDEAIDAAQDVLNELKKT